jgi:hypothetical protein
MGQESDLMTVCVALEKVPYHCYGVLRRTLGCLPAFRCLPCARPRMCYCLPGHRRAHCPTLTTGGDHRSSGEDLSREHVKSGEESEPNQWSKRLR